MTEPLPRLVATSVVRGSQKGQSHGGVYLIDFSSRQVEQKIDWNTGDIDFTGRGWDRGLRGIEFTEDEVWIAASDELFCYTPEFELVGSYRNQYLRHCHEICRKGHLLFLTSTGFDSILAFDLNSRRYVWGLYVSKNGAEWVGQSFDQERAGPAFINSYHLNMVRVDSDGVSFSGLNTRALLALSSDMSISEICSLPKGCHNAMPHDDGVLFNDTAADVVRYVSRSTASIAVPVPVYPEEQLEYQGVDDSPGGEAGVRARFVSYWHQPCGGRFFTFDHFYHRSNSGRTVTAVNLTMDIRNAIHGLECWPSRWP